MNSMIAVVFVVLAVAAVNAGVLAPAPLVASPWSASVVSSPLVAARSVVATPLSAGIVAPGLASPWALSRSVVGPAVLPAAATVW
ncbi:uncharacterized protein LOC111693035 [Anoplophora glabripennis]|uniref:uncharacterized protein LOC111693035 n=1 Tax=Anoplophora glabripennis TaxID=217634 RepID=UPI000C7722BC|nr:uncharacterized protein LOC111693035 [Anoplophora glabripennis]